MHTHTLNKLTACIAPWLVVGKQITYLSLCLTFTYPFYSCSCQVFLYILERIAVLYLVFTITEFLGSELT